MTPPPVYAPAHPQAIQDRPDWLQSNWKTLVGVVVVLGILAISTGLVYTQPWSKIKVIVSHSEHGDIGVVVYIDGILKASVGISPGTTIVGVWSVNAGTHAIQIDRGAWYYHDGWLSNYWYSESPDGVTDFTYAYQVGPLYTKNVYITLS